MNFKYKSFLYFIILISLCRFGTAQEKAYQVSKNISSKVLNEQRTFTIYLPENYHHPRNENVKYPVIYVLDGEDKGEITHAIYRFLANGFKPMVYEAIIVAVHQKDRFYELTPNISQCMHNNKPIAQDKKMGGAHAFLKFIQNELHQHIVQNYRINDFKGIIGHSLGGLFVLEAVIENPNYFNSAISIDPSLWWNEGYILQKLKAKNFESHTRFVLGLSKSTSDKQNQLSKQLISWLNDNHSFEKSKLLYLSDKNHHTIIIPSIQEGLIFCLGDESYMKIQEVGDLVSIKNYHTLKGRSLNMKVSISYQRWKKYAFLLEKLERPKEAEEIYRFID